MIIASKNVPSYNTFKKATTFSYLYSNFFFFNTNLFSVSSESEVILLFPKFFFLNSFLLNFRLCFYSGNEIKTFLIKNYHFGSISGSFIFTKLQGPNLRNRIRKKKTTKKKR
jgi:hypothetical protein